MAWEGASLANFVCAGLDSMHDTTETSAVGLETETLTFSSTNIISVARFHGTDSRVPWTMLQCRQPVLVDYLEWETARKGSVAPGHAGRR